MAKFFSSLAACATNVRRVNETPTERLYEFDALGFKCRFMAHAAATITSDVLYSYIDVEMHIDGLAYMNHRVSSESELKDLAEAFETFRAAFRNAEESKRREISKAFNNLISE